MAELSRYGEQGEGIPGSGTTMRESVDGDWHVQGTGGEWQVFCSEMEPG